MSRHGGACAWLLAALLLVAGHWARAASPVDPWRALEQRWFDTVGMADGLPHSITTALAQDRSGVLWIGTMGGLVRYDGYRTQVFDTADVSRGGLPDSYIRCLLELPDGSLLVGTNAGGLARFDPRDNRFRHYPTGPGGSGSRKIYGFAADGDRGVWIATEDGLAHLDLKRDRLQSVATGAQTAARDFAVLQDRAGNLWLGNNNGLFVRPAGRNTFERPAQPGGLVGDVLHDQIWALHEDAEGRLWAGSVQRGAVYRETDGTWRAVPGFSNRVGDVRQATVRDFREVTPNHMWIATDGSGIVSHVPGATGVETIDYDISLPSSLPGDAVRALLLDRAGNIWAATDAGAAHTKASPDIAFSVLPSIDTAHALSNPNVRSVFVDSRHRIWLGLAAGHIDLIDLSAGMIQHLHLGHRQRHRDVQSLAEAPDGSIWAGTQGLARIDPDTLAVQDALLPALGDAPVLSLLRYGPYMLMGTYGGAYRYDTRDGTLIHYRHRDDQPGSLAHDSVHQIARIGDAIWYATGDGISIARNPLQTSGFTNLSQRNGGLSGLPQNLVLSSAEDRRGRVWVGTLGGLGLLANGNAPPYDVRTFGTADGLVSDKVNAVLPDGDGNIWMSTTNGIAVIDGNGLRIRNLGRRDGQQITSYIYAAAARMADGTLLFGGMGGLTVIRPQRQPAHLAPPALRITNTLVNGHPLPFGRLPGDGDTLALGAHERNLRLDFALLDYQAPRETAYSYRLDGLDKDWIEVPTGSSPSAVYTNLPHGRYRLRLRAMPRGMHAQVAESTLAISVAPFWYETLWAGLAAALLLAALILAAVHLRTVYLRRRAQELQKQIKEHTRDLRAANRRLDLLAGTDELTGIHNRRRFLELAEVIRRDETMPVASMVLLDLDHFKRVNDTHGHLAGDAVLRATAEVIGQYLRREDLVGRYGGEELVMCLPGLAASEALAVAERIRLALRGTRIQHEDQTITVTASIGVAELKPGEGMNAWLSRADAALYASKRRGRDGCTLAV